MADKVTKDTPSKPVKEQGARPVPKTPHARTASDEPRERTMPYVAQTKAERTRNTLWLRPSSSSESKKLTKVAAGTLDTTKPTVIFFSGLLTTSKAMGFVKGASNHLAEMLGDDKTLPDTINVATWQYNSKRTNLMNAFNYNCRPNRFYSKEALTFVRDHIVPMVSENAEVDMKKRTITGTAKPRAEVKKAFDSLTFMGYSYGSVFVQEVYNASKDMMTKIGFSKEDTAALLSRIHTISMGAVSRPLHETNRYRMLTLIASNDRISKHKTRIFKSVREFLFSLREKLFYKSNKLKITKLSKRSALISAPVRKKIKVVKKDAQGTKTFRDAQMLFPKWWPRYSYHELQHYTTVMDHDNAYSKIANFALTNAVTRTKPLTVEEFLRVAKPLKGQDTYTNEEKAAYRKRVAAAITTL